ncbi:alpha/beta hydrolase family protein [Microbacterium gorillae]|uniref:alpha/beta hydrolase family protein n=1 Tax=Microbacterium gorillae TaxID=1231063 RepID=UPI00058B47B6|nr:alpha/beta hydrolase [Microbacterium gorillae]
MRPWGIGIGAVLVLLTGCAASGEGGGASPVPTRSAESAAPTSTPTAAPVATVEPLQVHTGEAPDCARAGDTALSHGDDVVDAVVYGTGPALILVPQVRMDVCGLDDRGREFAAEGYRVALVNADVPDPVGGVVAVANWLRANGTAEVGLVGTSRGATEVLAAAPLTDPAVVVALSPPTTFGDVDALTAMPEITAPILLIAGAEDDDFGEQATELSEAGAADLKLVIVADSKSHGADFLTADSPVRAQIGDFLTQHLPH